MAASITDLLCEPTTTSRPDAGALTAQKLEGAASITVDTTAGWPTATAVHFVIYQVTAAGVRVEGTQTEWKGIVTSSTAIGTLTLQAGTDQVYPIGSKVICTPTAAWGDDLIEGILTHADQDGTLKAGAVDNAAVIADGIITPAKFATALKGDWNAGLLPAVSSVTENGNRSADITFASTVASLLTPGMRIRTSRTVAAPTQSTSLNGTTQYYSKSSPNKLTFTDDFTCMGWVKLTSYANATIISRLSGTTGWALDINSSGQVRIYGENAGAGRLCTSYQSLPLNKWVHVVGDLNMSATTGEIFIDGILVPSVVTNLGAGAAALVQAGDLNIGAVAAGGFWPGKIAQVAVFDAILSASTIRSYKNQTLSGSETNLKSAYSFNNSFTDLNTTTPNDLTANGSAVATNADSPFTVDANGTPGGTYDWAIVTKVATTVATVQYPEGNAIPTSGGISTVDYSGVKSPFGMPVDENRWSLLTLNRILNTQSSAVVSTWYNIGSFYLTVPVGVWKLSALISSSNNQVATGGLNIYNTLSTSASTESDRSFSAGSNVNGSSISQLTYTSLTTGSVTTTAQTPYYGNVRTTNGTSITLYLDGANTGAVITAIPAYL